MVRGARFEGFAARPTSKERHGPHAGAATPVSDDYSAHGSAFTGRVQWVQIDVDEAAEDLDHLISPEERLAVAMARQ
jgi:hypothetical protein